MLRVTCPQQVVCVGLVEFGERPDTRTNWQHYTAADCRPTNQIRAWQAARGSGPTRPTRATSLGHPREDVGRVDEDVTIGCYEETVPVEFRLIDCSTDQRRLASDLMIDVSV